MVAVNPTFSISYLERTQNQNTTMTQDSEMS